MSGDRVAGRSGRVLDSIRQPVLNRPHEEPSQYWQLGDDNVAIGRALKGRRPSQARLIVPKAAGTPQGEQPALATVAIPDENKLINRIRAEVGRWRKDGYPNTTKATRELLHHWRSEANEPRLFFAQVEAAETLIWLTEAHGGHSPALADVRKQLAEANLEFNDGIERLAVRMATGSGKTAVMGMVIAWHALNAATSIRKDRYTTSFLAIAPGHTVRERLAVLNPSHPENVYDELRLVPEAKRKLLGSVKLQVLNFHAFQPRDRLADAKSSDAKKLLRGGSSTPEFESMTAVLNRALRGFPVGASAPKVCVLNDEAHHCYLPAEGRRVSDDPDDDGPAAVWFGALAGLRDDDRLGPVYDFSATPIFIEGGGRKERMFPWVVSDFPLMDAIESGLVKVPQVPVEDDTTGDSVSWRNLYANTTPKTVKRDSVPAELKKALTALYASYEQKYDLWMHPAGAARTGEPSEWVRE